jgi:hypothetical protein
VYTHVLNYAALDSCKAAAVEKVKGNFGAALDGYSLAADLLLFLGHVRLRPLLYRSGLSCLRLQILGSRPGHGGQAVLHRLYVAVNARLTAVVAEAPPLAL